MEIIQYTDEHNLFRKRVRTFMKEEVIPFVGTWEKEHIMPKRVWKKMGKEGFLCPTISPEYGGQGKDFLYDIIFAQEIVKTHHNGVGPSGHSTIMVPYIEAYACAEVKKKYIPGCIAGDIISAIAMTEPDAGSDVSAIKTTAVEVGDKVIINGSKLFITNGINSDVIVLAARDPDVKNSYEAMSLYLVEADSPGFKKGKTLNKMGMYSQDTAELFFNDCKIPIKNRLGEKGKGFYLLMKKLQQERLITAVWAMTAAEYMFELTFDFYKNNAGYNKPVPKSQANDFALVEIATEVKLGKIFIEKLIIDHINGKDVIIETSMAKYWHSDMAKRVADRCLDLYGDRAIIEAYCPVARYFRDIRSMSIFAGTNEIMKIIIAKFFNL